MRTVLIIEDDQTIRDVLAEALEGVGYRVMLASNGQEGLDAITQDMRPDLILLDLRMPVMTGAEFLRIKRTEFTELADIPVIGISASRQTDFPGMVAVLPKPIHLDRLFDTVERYSRPFATCETRSAL